VRPRCICRWWPLGPDPDDHVHSAAAVAATIMLSAGNRSGERPETTAYVPDATTSL